MGKRILVSKSPPTERDTKEGETSYIPIRLGGDIMARMSWTKMVLPKVEGGLGLCDPRLLTKVSTIKRAL